MGLESEIKSKAAKLSRTLARFGAIVLPAELKAPQVAAYEQEKGRLKEEIDFLQADLVKQKAQRKETPKHVRLMDLPEQERFVPLSPTRKEFLDTIKMIAYRTETALAAMLRQAMCRTDEASGTLTVRLHHLANRASDDAARYLAEQLNATETVYPGTNPTSTPRGLFSWILTFSVA